MVDSQIRDINRADGCTCTCATMNINAVCRFQHPRPSRASFVARLGSRAGGTGSLISRLLR